VGQTDGRISCLCHSIYRTIPMLCCASLGKNCVCYDYGDSFQNVSRVLLYATCIWEFHLHVLCAKNSRLSCSVCGLPKHFSRYKSFPVCDRQTDRQTDRQGHRRGMKSGGHIHPTFGRYTFYLRLMQKFKSALSTT